MTSGTRTSEPSPARPNSTGCGWLRPGNDVARSEPPPQRDSKWSSRDTRPACDDITEQPAASRLERDVHDVHDDLHLLAEYDIVHFEKDGRAKKPYVPL